MTLLKKGDNYNQLSNAEAERLALFAEELGEVQQEIGKILRHGYEQSNPNIKKSQTNRKNLSKEIGDVLVALELMTLSNDVNETDIQNAADIKANNVWAFLHHQSPELKNRVLEFLP